MEKVQTDLLELDGLVIWSVLPGVKGASEVCGDRLHGERGPRVISSLT